MFYKMCLCYASHQLIFFPTPLVHLEGRSEKKNLNSHYRNLPLQNKEKSLLPLPILGNVRDIDLIMTIMWIILDQSILVLDGTDLPAGVGPDLGAANVDRHNEQDEGHLGSPVQITQAVIE